MVRNNVFKNNKLIDSIVKNRKSSKDADIINDPKDIQKME